MNHKLGVVGLGVMGGNLALNAERNGFAVAGYDLDAGKTRTFVEGPGAGKQVSGADSPTALMAVLERPRRVLMMVPAGAAVDSAVAHLKPHLEPGDILIDGGNSWFLDTERRSKALSAEGFHFVGMGVSGGEEGALWGPSMMPGGHREAYDALAPILLAMAAKADDGAPCVEYMGPLGAGHYVKMVHNGIEYGDMQLIAETYDVLHRGLGLSNDELHDVFSEWNAGELRSYLIEITAAIFAQRDPESGGAVLDLILDEAAQKGTGKWTSQNALDVGAPIPTINAAVESRIISALKTERVAASRILRGPVARPTAARGSASSMRHVTRSMPARSRRMRRASACCGSRHRNTSTTCGPVSSPKSGAPAASSALAARRHHGRVRPQSGSRQPAARRGVPDALERRQDAWRFFVQTAVSAGHPGAGDGLVARLLRCLPQRARLPANLTQAQRDYFGAHTYRRLDRDGVFHTDWTQ